MADCLHGVSFKKCIFTLPTMQLSPLRFSFTELSFLRVFTYTKWNTIQFPTVSNMYITAFNGLEERKCKRLSGCCNIIILKRSEMKFFPFNLSCVVYLYFRYFTSFCWQYLQTFSWMFTGLLLMFSNIVVLLLVLQWGIGCRTESLHLYKRKGSKYSFILYLMMMMSVSSSKSECINCWEWRKSRASI